MTEIIQEDHICCYKAIGRKAVVTPLSGCEGRGQCSREGVPEMGGGTMHPLEQISARSAVMGVGAEAGTCASSALAVLFSHKTRSQIIS